MLKSNIIDTNLRDPRSNIYGCSPCPRCGNVHRMFKRPDLIITCSCGFKEQGVEK